MIRAIVADDEILARLKLRQLLREEAEIEIVGEGSTAAETVDLVRNAVPIYSFSTYACPAWTGLIS